jgi:DNA-binding transcriptional ArsR family regulator
MWPGDDAPVAALDVPGGDLALLRELAPPNGYSPDFLTPEHGFAGLGEGIDRVMSTPKRVLRQELDFLVSRTGSTTWIRELASGDVSVMRRLGVALGSYHDSALAPYWQSIRDHVTTDRARRLQQLGRKGIDAVLGSLHGAAWDPPVLQIFDFVDFDVHLDGRGVLLQPSLFCWQAPTKLHDTSRQPVIVYPTQPPPGTLRRPAAASRPAPLAGLLGRTRAEALEAAVTGCSTSELAKHCGVSLAAASQQATVLREAGLITTRREGVKVVHEVTALGLALLNGEMAGV